MQPGAENHWADRSRLAPLGASGEAGLGLLRSVVTTWSRRGLDIVDQLTGELRLVLG